MRQGFNFSGYFWVPIVGPLIGGVIGVLIYDLFIGDILHARLKMVEDVAVRSRKPSRSTDGGLAPRFRKPGSRGRRRPA